MRSKLKIGELAKRTGFSTKAIRYYELVGLLNEPPRSASGYRLYAESDAERLDFIDKAKRLGFSLEEIRDILLLSEQQRPCVHVLALIDQKIQRVDEVLRELRTFRRELAKLRKESADQIERLPADAAVCGIVERGVHAKGEAALAWLEFRQPGKRGRGKNTEIAAESP